MKRKITFAVLLAVVALGGFAIGQAGTTAPAETFLENWTAADNGGGPAYSPLMDSYAKMPGNADVTKQAARIGLVTAKRGDNGPALTALVMQNQKIIEQNAQVIGLLIKLNAKK